MSRKSATACELEAEHTVDAAAELLRADPFLNRVSARTLRRMVRDGRVSGRVAYHAGRKRLLIPESQIVALKQSARKAWADRLDTGFAAWDEERVWAPYIRFWPTGQDAPKILPRYELILGEPVELHRFAFARLRDSTEYESVRTEISLRLPGEPAAFEVKFVFDPDRLALSLERLVRRVAVPRPLLQRCTEVRLDALSHLQTQAIRGLRRAADPERYLLRCVKNHYRDLLRSDQRAHGEALDLDRLV